MLALEAVIALGYAALEVGQVRMTRAAVGVGVAILMAGFGLLLLLVARGVFRGQRWSRGPAVATQLILLPIALELPRRYDHLGVGDPSRIGDRCSGRGAAPSVDRGLRRAACR